MGFAWKQQVNETQYEVSDKAPVVIIGAGPVGVRVAQLLLKENPGQNIVIYGNEPRELYDRVKLSSFLSGELGWFKLIDTQRIPDVPNITHIHNCEVVDIDKDLHTVTDKTGRVQSYSELVIATGSHPHMPSIPGIDKQHIYYFRGLNDVEQLSVRRSRSRRTVVVGGGLLGLEAARVMQRQNTEVVVIDHALHLMSQQLDESAATACISCHNGHKDTPRSDFKMGDIMGGCNSHPS